MEQMKEWKKEFSQQIELFFNENKQSQEELDIKMKVMSRIEEIIERAVPNVQLRLYPYGSTTNCCGAKDSDIDIYMKATTRRQRKHFLNGILGFLELMKAQLTKEFGSDFKELELRNAAVPIINIIFGDKIDSRFAKLGLLIKSWAEKNKIYGSDNGGMNGISYLVMLVHYLQKGASPPVLPNLQSCIPMSFVSDAIWKRSSSKNESSVVDLLIGFFKYYSNFSWRTEKITMDEDLFMKRGKRNKDNIFVKDPYGSPNLAKLYIEKNDKVNTLVD
ncbi:unnamed protein product, partial [Mesorhabditis belari]|uniref:Uncharacterized protein n=1 Tax=Mesorhabditis belari TaxID=2138241 RepID=A0AAF3FIE3_9BILA